MTYSAMTTKALNNSIRRYQMLISQHQDAIRSIVHNYRKCTGALSIEAKSNQIQDREERINWCKQNISLIQTELQNRA